MIDTGFREKMNELLLIGIPDCGRLRKTDNWRACCRNIRWRRVPRQEK